MYTLGRHERGARRAWVLAAMVVLALFIALAATSLRVDAASTKIGSCGRVTFVNYHSFGPYYVIMDSDRGIWYVNYQVDGMSDPHTGIVYGTGAPHLEFGGSYPSYSGEVLHLTGWAMTSTGPCGIIPSED
jgi:hypothetical protein